jgi:hypothetical protein
VIQADRQRKDKADDGSMVSDQNLSVTAPVTIENGTWQKVGTGADTESSPEVPKLLTRMEPTVTLAQPSTTPLRCGDLGMATVAESRYALRPALVRRPWRRRVRLMAANRATARSMPSASCLTSGAVSWSPVMPKTKLSA